MSLWSTDRITYLATRLKVLAGIVCSSIWNMSRYCCKGLGCFSEAYFCQARETFEACPSLSRGKPDELRMSVMVQHTRTEIYMRTQPHAGSSGLRLDYSVPVHCDTFCVKLSNFKKKIRHPMYTIHESRLKVYVCKYFYVFNHILKGVQKIFLFSHVVKW